MNYKVLVAALLAASAVGADSGMQPPPLHWSAMNGTTVDGDRCAMGVDGDLRTAGQRNLSLSCDTQSETFAALRQTFDATPFWGKRIRFSAWIKTDGLDGEGEGEGTGSGIFIEYNSQQNGGLLDLMRDRALTGWTDWERRELVADIPRDGQWFTIGFWMRGQGKAWLRDPVFEVVPDSVPVNVLPLEQGIPGEDAQ